MITEERAAWAIPKAGWLRDYCIWAMRQTTAPLAYHLLYGMSVLGATNPISFGHRYAGDLYGNFYGLAVGRSGEDQKSSALGLARRILYEVDPILIGAMPGSSEGMIDELAARPRQTIFYSEFGAFLAKAQKKGSYFEPMKALLTDLWDCSPQSRAKAGNKVIRCDTPRLSIAAACSIPYLEAHTEPHDLTGGFLGRWAIMLAHRERTNPDPTGDIEGLSDLIEAIRYRAGLDEVAPCLGLSDAAKERWSDWFYELDRRKLPKLIAGTRTRAPAIARKAAMLLAWDWGEALQGEPWHINEQHIEYGIRFTELHLASVISLAERLAEHPDALLRRQVLTKIPEGATMSLGQIMLATKLRKRTLMEILSGLVIEGTLTMDQFAGGGEADQIYTHECRPG
jgi:hypothetical protein